MIQPSVAGKASFPGVPPGAYRAEACEDAVCLRVSAAWESVEVTAARTVTLGEPR